MESIRRVLRNMSARSQYNATTLRDATQGPASYCEPGFSVDNTAPDQLVHAIVRLHNARVVHAYCTTQ